MSIKSLEDSHQVQIVADFDSAYNELKIIVSGDKFTANEIVPFIMKAIRLVEHVSKDSGDRGDAKKALVLRLIERLIAETPLSSDQKSSLNDVLDKFGPPLIDGLIAADRGLLLARSRFAWKKLTCCCS